MHQFKIEADYATQRLNENQESQPGSINHIHFGQIQENNTVLRLTQGCVS